MRSGTRKTQGRPWSAAWRPVLDRPFYSGRFLAGVRREWAREFVTLANSKYLQNSFANCIWRGVRHSASNRRGDATTTQTHFADGAVKNLHAARRAQLG
jgi:hypothetical protein